MHFESFFSTLALAFSLLTRLLSPTGALGSDVVTLKLLPPNLVVQLLNFTDQGRIGTFSMMYDQGIEIRSFSLFTLSHFSPTFKHTHTGTQAHRHTHTRTHTHMNSMGHGDSKAVVMFIFSFLHQLLSFLLSLSSLSSAAFPRGTQVWRKAIHGQFRVRIPAGVSDARTCWGSDAVHLVLSPDCYRLHLL